MVSRTSTTTNQSHSNIKTSTQIPTSNSNERSTTPTPDSTSTDVTIYVDLDEMPDSVKWNANDGQTTQSPFLAVNDKLKEYFFQVRGIIIKAFLSNRDPYGHSIQIEISQDAANKINTFCLRSPAAKAIGYKKVVENTNQVVFKYKYYPSSLIFRCSSCKTHPRGSGLTGIIPESCDNIFRDFWSATNSRNVVPDYDHLPTLEPLGKDEGTDKARVNKFVPGREVVVEFAMSSYAIGGKESSAGVRLTFLSIGLVPMKETIVHSPKRQKRH